MRKLFFVIGRLNPIGGEERSLSLLCNALLKKEAGYDITIACLEGGEAVFPLDGRIRVIYLQQQAASRAARVKKLLKIARGGGFDLIIGYGKTARLPAAIAGKLSNPHLVFCERIHPYFENDTLKRKLWRVSGMYLLRGQYGVFQSHGTIKYYKKLKGYRVIPNMLDAGALPDVKGFSKREGIIMNAGRMSHQKNQAMLIRAYANVRHGDGTLLHIYGDGELKPELESLINQLDADDYITLKPASRNIHEHMNSAKYYVCSSDTEGYPNSLLEAMAMGMACITTDCSGAVRELVEDGVNGIIVPAGDEAAMTDALRRLITDDDFAEKIGKNAEKVRQTNAAGTLIGEWMSFFDEVCQENRPPDTPS